MAKSHCIYVAQRNSIYIHSINELLLLLKQYNIRRKKLFHRIKANLIEYFLTLNGFNVFDCFGAQRKAENGYGNILPHSAHSTGILLKFIAIHSYSVCGYDRIQTGKSKGARQPVFFTENCKALAQDPIFRANHYHISSFPPQLPRLCPCRIFLSNDVPYC